MFVLFFTGNHKPVEIGEHRQKAQRLVAKTMWPTSFDPKSLVDVTGRDGFKLTFTVNSIRSRCHYIRT